MRFAFHCVHKRTAYVCMYVYARGWGRKPCSLHMSPAIVCRCVVSWLHMLVCACVCVLCYSTVGANIYCCGTHFPHFVVNLRNMYSLLARIPLTIILAYFSAHN